MTQQQRQDKPRACISETGSTRPKRVTTQDIPPAPCQGLLGSLLKQILPECQPHPADSEDWGCWDLPGHIMGLRDYPDGMGFQGRSQHPSLLPVSGGHQPFLRTTATNHVPPLACGQNVQPPPCYTPFSPRLGCFRAPDPPPIPAFRQRFGLDVPTQSPGTGRQRRLQAPPGGQGAPAKESRDVVLDPDPINSAIGQVPSQPWPQLPHLKRKGRPPILRSLPVLMVRGSIAQGMADAIQEAREQQR